MIRPLDSISNWLVCFNFQQVGKIFVRIRDIKCPKLGLNLIYKYFIITILPKQINGHRRAVSISNRSENYKIGAKPTAGRDIEPRSKPCLGRQFPKKIRFKGYRLFKSPAKKDHATSIKNQAGTKGDRDEELFFFIKLHNEQPLHPSLIFSFSEPKE